MCLRSCRDETHIGSHGHEQCHKPLLQTLFGEQTSKYSPEPGAYCQPCNEPSDDKPWQLEALTDIHPCGWESQGKCGNGKAQDLSVMLFLMKQYHRQRDNGEATANSEKSRKQPRDCPDQKQGREGSWFGQSCL